MYDDSYGISRVISLFFILLLDDSRERPCAGKVSTEPNFNAEVDRFTFMIHMMHFMLY